MTLESAILEKVRRLPAAQQAEVSRFADDLDHALHVQAPRHRAREIARLEQNHQAYVGQWAVLQDDTLIAAGGDALEVYRAAKAKGIESPFVIHVAAEDTLPFVAGW